MTGKMGNLRYTQIFLCFVLVCVVLVSISACSMFGNQDKLVHSAVEKYDAGLYSESLPVFTEVATKGHAEALHYLGRHYHFGQGVDQDYAAAAKYYQTAADAGSFKSMNNLGTLYLHGNGVPKNTEKAVALFTESSQHGVYQASYNLADIYYSRKAFEKARALYETAASYGDAVAQRKLGVMAFSGEGGPKNYQQAANYTYLSALQGDAQAQQNMGYLYEHGFGVQQNLNEAFDWYLKSARNGNASAQYMLGSFYDQGKGTPQDYRAAADWYRKSASQGVAPAKYQLGVIYYQGKGVTKQPKTAFHWFNKAAADDYGPALLTVGYSYLQGMGTGKNLNQARHWCLRASKNKVEGASDCVSRVDAELASLARQRSNSYARKTEKTDDTTNWFMLGAAILGGIAIVNAISDDAPVANSNSSGSCRENAINRIGVCEVKTDFDTCTSSGCGNKLDCYDSQDGGDGDECAGFWVRLGVSSGGGQAGNIYCDTRNPKNISDNIEEVIGEICR